MNLRDELRGLLAAYAAAEGATPEVALQDATTDLIHLADESGVLFDDVYEGACEVFAEEVG